MGVKGSLIRSKLRSKEVQLNIRQIGKEQEKHSSGKVRTNNLISDKNRMDALGSRFS